MAGRGLDGNRSMIFWLGACRQAPSQKGAILDQLCPHPMTLKASEPCCHRLAGVLFPWDITRALELALLKTFCVPSISALLAHTGEFEQRPRKRYDDTGLMVAELLRHGLDSAPGAAVSARMNRIHGHYAITNDDFLYVLSASWPSRSGGLSAMAGVGSRTRSATICSASGRRRGSGWGLRRSHPA